jgi:IMP dehydrogenase
MLKNKYSIALNEVGIIPESPITYSDDDVNLAVDIGQLKLKVPIISAAMDSVSSDTVLAMVTGAGGLGVINLCGLISRYEISQYQNIYKKILEKPVLSTLQEIYNSKKIDVAILRNNLWQLRGKFSAEQWEHMGASATPQYAEELFDIARAANIKTMVMQSSFISPFWKSTKHEGINILKYTERLHGYGCTVLVGNVASLDVAIPFISAGVDAIILGIGPGQQCTTRFALGIGAGHITSISEVREYIERHQSGTRLIADGGIHNSGDIVKLLCTGAHAVILGGMFARTVDAPFCGYHWGMSAFHRVLPRGDLLTFEVADGITAERVLFGPSYKADGTMAVLPALTNALSNLECLDISDAYHKTSVVRFPGIASEGKIK